MVQELTSDLNIIQILKLFKEKLQYRLYTSRYITIIVYMVVVKLYSRMNQLFLEKQDLHIIIGDIL